MRLYGHERAELGRRGPTDLVPDDKHDRSFIEFFALIWPCSLGVCRISIQIMGRVAYVD